MARNPNDVGAATLGVAVTPHDTTQIAATAALWVSGAGNLTVQFKDKLGTSVDMGAVTVGMLLPISVVRVMDTGTDATVIALY